MKAILIMSFLILVGCDGGGKSSKTFCGPCGGSDGPCSEGETCRRATDGNDYCFRIKKDGNIDGVCP